MRKHPWFTALAILVPLGAGSALSAASSAPEDDLPGLVSKADWIAEVEVLDARAERLPDGRIQTVFTFSSLTPMKGQVASIQEISLPGGECAGQGLFLPGMPRLEVGDRHILFLTQPSEQEHWRIPVGLGSGAFRVQADSRGAGRTVVRAALGEEENRSRDYGKFLTRIVSEVQRQRR